VSVSKKNSTVQQLSWEMIEPEAEVVDSESILSGNVLVYTVNPPRSVTPSAGDLHHITGSVISCGREGHLESAKYSDQCCYM